MTAGRGIVHSEMPKQEDGLMWGFQLWINLPSALKMCEPRYQDIPAAAVPVKILDGGVTVRVIAGQSSDVIGPVQDIITEPIYLDVAIPLGFSPGLRTDMRRSRTTSLCARLIAYLPRVCWDHSCER